MTKVEAKYLSDKEIVKELYESKRPTWSAEESTRRFCLQEEILRRLEEPWRRLKQCINIKQHKEEIKELTEKFFNDLNGLNYKGNMRHQINNMKRGLKPDYEKNELDPREYYG